VDDLGRQRTDVLGGRDGDSVVPAAERVDGVRAEVDDAEAGLEQEAGEQSRRHDDPLRRILTAQQVTDVELFVEQILGTVATYDVVVHAELPGEVARYPTGESGSCQLHLGTRPCGHADATDDGVVAAHDCGQLGDRCLRNVEFDERDARGGQVGGPPLRVIRGGAANHQRD
jgi:hypothetical protein